MSDFMVVGADGSAPGLRAVVRAAREAEVRNKTLRVVHALARPAPAPRPRVPLSRGWSFPENRFRCWWRRLCPPLRSWWVTGVPIPSREL